MSRKRQTLREQTQWVAPVSYTHLDVYKRQDQVGLAVAVDARDAHDLARTGGEGNILYRIALVQAGGHLSLIHI